MCGLGGGCGLDAAAIKPGFLGGVAGFGFLSRGGGRSLGDGSSELERGFEIIGMGLSSRLSVLLDTALTGWWTAREL